VQPNRKEARTQHQQNRKPRRPRAAVGAVTLNQQERLKQET
jgi:hypothetical protein